MAHRSYHDQLRQEAKDAGFKTIAEICQARVYIKYQLQRLSISFDPQAPITDLHNLLEAAQKENPQ